MVWQIVRRLPALSRRKKRSILVAYDLAAMVVALWAAFSTRLGFLYVPASRTVILSAAVSFAAMRDRRSFCREAECGICAPIYSRCQWIR